MQLLASRLWALIFHVSLPLLRERPEYGPSKKYGEAIREECKGELVTYLLGEGGVCDLGWLRELIVVV